MICNVGNCMGLRARGGTKYTYCMYCCKMCCTGTLSVAFQSYKRSKKVITLPHSLMQLHLVWFLKYNFHEVLAFSKLWIILNQNVILVCTIVHILVLGIVTWKNVCKRKYYFTFFQDLRNSASWLSSWPNSWSNGRSSSWPNSWSNSWSSSWFKIWSLHLTL